jgi:sulfotransferase
MVNLEHSVSHDELYLAHPKPNQVGQMIANVINYYYSDIDKPVVFDKNRSWVQRLHYIPGYFGTEAKVICPVRSPAEILASFISMHRRNPYETNGKLNFLDEMLVKSGIPLTDNNRCQFLASNDGILGQSYTGLKQALYNGHDRSLHFVEYDDLINDPEATMRKIYQFLGEEYFEHTFDNLENINQENDAAVYGIADMHAVRPKLDKKSIDPAEILSPEIIAACKDTEFWRDIDSTDLNIGDDTKEPSNIIGA